MSVLKQKILDRSVTLGVVGLGYVGLPLAVEKAKAGFHVIGFDVQPQKVDMVNQGHNYIGDVVDSDLKKIVEEGMLRATTDFASVASCDCVCIAVPTPLDAHQQPDISYVRSSAESIMPHMHRDMLVVLESTTYPGTTEEMLRPILEKSGLKCGVDFFLAFSPERVDPGNAIYKTKNTPKVVGGVTPECTDIAATLYEAVLEAPVHRVSSPAVAEMEKILENTYRNVTIGLINELAILCNRMDIDLWEVIEAAKTKPFGFTAFYPGPGLGGHCIPLDPYYLTWKAREYGFHTSMIEASMMTGAVLAGASEKELKVVEQAAENIGLAFQIQDDILDVTSTQEELGKPIHSDEKNNKVTYVSLVGAPAAASRVKELSDHAVELLDDLDRKNGFLDLLVESLVSRRK